MAARMSLAAAATTKILFDVEGYATTKEMAADGEFFESEMLSVGGYDWAVRYYPGSGEPYCSFISVVLVLLIKSINDGGKVGVRFECTLMDSCGEPSTEVWKRSSYIFSHYGEEKGFWEYAMEDELDLDRQGDCFTLSCIVSVLKKPDCILNNSLSSLSLNCTA